MWDGLLKTAGRAVAGLGVAAAVTVVGLLGSYWAYGDRFAFRKAEYYTRSELDVLEGWIRDHREAVGRPPTRLVDLEKVAKSFEVDADGRPLDEWRRPYQYAVEGGRIVLYSFGRDGRPGGEGSDADVYPRSADRPFRRPTLRQFVFELPTAGIWTAGAVAGISAGASFFSEISRGRYGVRGVAVLAAAAFLIGSLLAVLIGFLASCATWA